MLIETLYIVCLASSATSRYVPRYADLDEEEKLLFKAAYESPSYEHEEYQEPEEPLGKLDLLKDGMWALKSNIKKMKTFDKALAAHLLATKLEVKELLGTLKKHHHVEIEKKKPVYHYQSPPAPEYHHYEPEYYTPPAPEHHYSAQHTSASSQYSTPQQTPPKYQMHSYTNPAPTKYEPHYPTIQNEPQPYPGPQPIPIYGHDPYNGY